MKEQKPASSKNEKLSFQKGSNAKLDSSTWTFSLPAGWSCPGANDCKACADPDTGRIMDSGRQKFRCYAATMEMRPSVRESRWRNFKLLQNASLERNGMFDIILNSLPKNASKIRVHVSGDFFSQAYFNAWMQVAEAAPWTRFYAYTKSLGMVKHYINSGFKIPGNFVITASIGGVWDNLWPELEAANNKQLKSCTVVFHPSEAEELGLEIDHDDSHACIADGKSFALLLHGTQKAGSVASAAIKTMKEEGISYSYGSK
jgi:hypothetical protein